MPYCSTSDVIRTAGLSASDLTTADLTQFILDAESEIDRLTNTTFWKVEQSGTATAGGASTITNASAHFGTASELVGDYVWIYGGTGANQLGLIASHTDTAITVDTAWATQPDNTSQYRIIHTGQDPRRSEYRMGDRSAIMFTNKYPLVYLSQVSIDSTSITLTQIYQDLETGRLELSNSAPVSFWSMENVQANQLSYWYGVYPVPRVIQRATSLLSALKALNNKMGLNTDAVGSVTLPEGSISVGQPTQNIKNVIDSLQKQYDLLVPTLPKYPAFF